MPPDVVPVADLSPLPTTPGVKPARCRAFAHLLEEEMVVAPSVSIATLGVLDDGIKAARCIDTRIGAVARTLLSQTCQGNRGR
jgi:hypothetical protein